MPNTAKRFVIVYICVAHEYSQRAFSAEKTFKKKTSVGADKKTSKTVRTDYLKTLITSTDLDCISLGFVIMKSMLN